MKKKKLLIIVLVLLMLITSFFVLTKKPKIKYKKLKELNYNVTYKQAFPDENLRRGVLLCIMRNKCETLYGGQRYHNLCIDTSSYANDTNLGPVITEDDLKAKEEEQISKVSLDKIKQVLANSCSKNITSLQGIEYLTNLEEVILRTVTQSTDLDFSYNKELKYLLITATNANSINLTQNLKLEEIFGFLSQNEKNLDLSHLTSLYWLEIDNSGIKNVNLPSNVYTVRLSANKITDITIPTSVRKLMLNSNNITNITLPEGIEEVSLSRNNIENITIPTSVRRLDLNYNKISNIDLPNGIKSVSLDENKISNITLPAGVDYVRMIKNKIENIVFSGYVKSLEASSNNITNITLPEGIEEVSLASNNIENITIPTSVKRLNLSSNKISNIDLPTNIQTAELNNNKISNIGLSKNNNLLGLKLHENPLEDIDVRNNPNLSLLKFGLKTEKDTIDFSHNPNLREVKIYGKDGGKIKSLDFSNQPNLSELILENLGITNLNIENNLKLSNIYLEKNNLNTIDLSKNKNIWYVQLYNNNTQNFKIPYKFEPHFTVYISEVRKLKVKKNSYVTIPSMIYNDKEYFLEDKPYYYYKVGNKYVFKHVYNNVSIRAYRWTYEIKVEAGEEDSFNPVFDQGNYTPFINEEIPVDRLKEMITNLPNNIKNFEVLSQNTFTEKGDKTVKVRITFSDTTFKEVDIPVKVYEKEDILPTVNVTPETLEVIEKKPVNINITRSYAKEDNIDNTNFIKTVRDNLVSYEYLNKANGLTYNSNGIAGVIDYLFTGTEEEHTFNITYKEKGNIYTFNKNISIKLLRDTDKDGIADKDDDDKDGDGFSNAVEIARGSDPYNKDSLPDMSKKDELDNLVKQLEKLIEDTKNNPFDTKNKIDVDNLKNNYLPGKVTEKDNIKGSYSATTSDSDLLKLIEKTKKEIDDIKKEINKLRDKANFDELDKEIAKEIDEDFYLEDTVKVLKDKIKEAKDMSKDTSTQEEVDKLTKDIKDLRAKLVINKTKLKEKIKDVEEVIDSGKYNEEEFQKLLKQAKDLYNKDSFTKKEMLDMIEKLDDLLNRKGSFINPNTGIKTYSLVILFIIFVSYLVFKKHKNYIR